MDRMTSVLPRKRRPAAAVATILIASLLAACSTPVAPDSPNQLVGIVGGSAALPTLAGRPLDLGGAAVTVDGETATAARVLPGMDVVATGGTVAGSFRARQVDIRYRVRGELDVIDDTARTLEVVGVLVRVPDGVPIAQENPDGSHDELAFADLLPGDVLKVAGLPQDDDGIVATRLERIRTDHPERVDLWLRLRGLDPDAATFSYGMGTHTVDYSGARTHGTPTEGALVRLRGVRDGLIVTAERIHTREGGRPAPPPGVQIVLHGPLTLLDEAGQQFEVLGFTVDYSAARVIGTLQEGARVLVKGVMEDAAGPVRARLVKVQHDGPPVPVPHPRPVSSMGTI